MDRKRIVFLSVAVLVAVAVCAFVWSRAGSGDTTSDVKVAIPPGEHARTEDEPERLLQKR